MKKTIVVHIDGIPTHFFKELSSRTVLQAARIPHLDNLVRQGEFGRIGVSKDPRPFGGELAFVSLLGYDTQKWYVGPGAFEGVNMEVILDRNDVAFLCDFVTLRAEDGWGEGKKLGSALVLDDASGGGLETEDARELIDAINEQLVSENIQFYLGHEARHLMVWVGGNTKIQCRNPQEILGQAIVDHLPSGEGSQILRELMEASREILQHHTVNEERLSAGLKPVNCLWPWGQSKPVELTPLNEQWPLQGVVVSPSGSYRGVGLASGLKAVNVFDGEESGTPLLGKMATFATKILEKQDLACFHLPVPWVAKDPGSLTPVSRCVDFLEHIDEHLIGALHEAYSDSSDVRLWVVASPAVMASEVDSSSVARYVLYEGPKMDKEPTAMVFDDHSVSDLPLQNASTFLERFFGKR